MLFVQLLRYLIEECGVPIEDKNRESYNPLHLLAEKGDCISTDYLLSDRKTPINSDRVCAKALGEIPDEDEMSDDENSFFLSPKTNGEVTDKDTDTSKKSEVFKKMLR